MADFEKSFQNVNLVMIILCSTARFCRKVRKRCPIGQGSDKSIKKNENMMGDLPLACN